MCFGLCNIGTCMRTFRMEMKDKILSRMAKDELIDKHVTLVEEHSDLITKNQNLMDAFKGKQDAKNKVISELHSKMEVLQEKVSNQALQLDNLQDSFRHRKEKYVQLDLEYKFLATEIRRRFGNYVFADIMTDNNNPREFTEEDFDGLITGRQAQQHRLNSAFKIITRNLKTMFLELKTLWGSK